MYEELFAALAAADVRYVVVGGVAVVLQGHTRMTMDLDLIIDFERENVLHAIRVLEAHGCRPAVPAPATDFADPEIRREWIEAKNMQVFSMRNAARPPLVVDLFVKHPIPFDELWSRADVITVAGVEVPIASIPDLIALKRMARRPQDIADIEKLEQLAEERSDER